MVSAAAPTPSASTQAPLPQVPVTQVLFGLMLAILLGALEQSIVAVVLPDIALQLNGFDDMAWVISAYLVASTVVTPIYGKLSDVLGRRAVLSFSIVLFTLASVFCAMATSMPMLILARILQGLGGGGLISVSQATIGDVVPLRERGRYQGYVSGVWAVASMAGPVIGGYLAHWLSWRWIFWINLPLALIALIVVRRALRHLPVSGRRHRIDYPGALLFGGGLTGVLVFLTRLGQGHSPLEAASIGLLLAGLLGLAIFVWQERRASDPVIPLDLLTVPTVAICCTTLFLCFFQLIAMSVLLPLRFQVVGGAPADIAALRLVPLTLAIPLGAFISGRMMSWTGRYKPLQMTGSVIAPIAIVGLAFVPVHDVLPSLLVMVVLGVSLGLQFPSGLVATQNAVPQQQMGIATALTAFSRLLGGAVGVAVLTTVLIALLRHSGVAMSAGHAGEDVLMSMFRRALSGADQADAMAVRAAAEHAFRTLFLLSAAVSLISPFLVMRLKEVALRGSPAEAAKAAAAAAE
ncbi:MDR family MFS transporter [Cupriavidus plantarum]|uniref:MDR family MFS transporter n=1 Tax=Cupriavidus plantarum TaxID=942865 RepID=UPI000E3B4989|nr:MDR family MFS transporter [Cupriavidus plantarum]NYI01146.1 EmrB/QacA subfamily drug resistance transporter [Cupriavidus plantarum]REE94015.1 EmrB/QacA subfamily drug resistance transporter [Cupriavidus plantarum]